MEYGEATYHQARRFWDAWQLLGMAINEKSEKVPRYSQCFIPAVVLLAFSCELHMKCLIYCERGSKSKNHDLAGLFGDLSDARQSDIRSVCTPFASTRGSDFQSELEGMAKLFTEWRYLNEGWANPVDINPDLLKAMVVRSEFWIKEHFPGWSDDRIGQIIAAGRL